MNNKQKKLIIIDGLPGSGKTTLVNWLSLKYEGLVISEVPNHKLAKPFTEKYFIKCEEIKIDSVCNSDCEYNFMDRSPISLMAHNYGRFVLGYENVYYELDKWHQVQMAKLNSTHILYIYTRISNVNLCNERKWGRNLKTMPESLKNVQGAKLWTEEKFLVVLRDFFDAYYKRIDNKLVVDCDMISLGKIDELIRFKIDTFLV